MNRSTIAASAPAATALSAASSATVSVFGTIGTAADSVNSAVAAFGRLAQACDIKSDEWLFRIQEEARHRRPIIAGEAALLVRQQSGAKFQAHLESMKDPGYAAGFKFVDDLINASLNPPVAQAA